MRYTPIFDEKGVQEALARLLNVLELKDEHKYEREHSAYGFWARTGTLTTLTAGGAGWRLV